MTPLLIALGGALGSLCRYGLGGLVQRSAAVGFPVGTLTVNVIGCFLAGGIAKLFFQVQAHPDMKAMLIVGFCGGFTTFSAFSLETVALIQGGQWSRAIVYASASVVACVVATAAGLALARPLSL
jgi:fluoride exporter